MNVQSQYNKVQSGELKKEYFLQEALKDSRFKNVITRTNSYEDVVSIFKTKGYIQDETKIVPQFDLMGSISRLQEASAKKPELDADHVNYYEYQKGWRLELLNTKGDIEKAKAKALKNLNTDDIYYTRLEMGTKKPTKRTDLPTDISKKGSSMKDEANGYKPVKGVEKPKADSAKSSDPKASKTPQGVKTMKGGQGAAMKSLKESADVSEGQVDPKDLKTIDKLIKAVNILIEKGVDSDGDPLEFADSTSTWEEEYSYKPVVRKGNVITFISRSPYSNGGKEKVETENLTKGFSPDDAIGTLRGMIKGYKKAYKKAGIALPTSGDVSSADTASEAVSDKKKVSESVSFENVADKIQKDFPELEDKFIEIGKLFKKVLEVEKSIDGDDSNVEFTQEKFDKFVELLSKCIDQYQGTTYQNLKDKAYESIEEIFDFFLDNFKKALKFAEKKKSYQINPPSKDQFDADAKELLGINLGESKDEKNNIFNKVIDAATKKLEKIKATVKESSVKEAEAGEVVFDQENGGKSVEVRDLGYVDGKKMYKINKTENNRPIGSDNDVVEDKDEAIGIAKKWVGSATEATSSPESNLKDLKKKYASPENPATVSFTFKDPNKGGEVVQYEGQVKDIVKSKTPGAYVLKMNDGASVAVMNDNSGKPAVVYMPKDGKDPIKNPDVNTDDAQIFDDILGKSSDKSSLDEQLPPLLGENDIVTLREQIKTIIVKKLKEYAINDDLNESTDFPPEVGKLLLTILTIVGPIGLSVATFVDAYRSASSEERKEMIRKLLLKKKQTVKEDLTPDAPVKPGPKVQMKLLKHELRNMDWEALSSDNTYQKKNNQERLQRMQQLVSEIGDDAKALFNTEAPEQFHIKEDNQAHQQVKDLEDMRPEDIADTVLDQDFNPHSIKTKAAALILGNALKEDPKDDNIKKAFMKLTDLMKKK